VKIAHRHATNEKLDAKQRLKWARIEAYLYQVINTLLRAYDVAQIKQQLEQLKKMIKDELGKGA